MEAKHILTIGIAYQPVRGGIAAVESVYSTFYKPFNHIATVTAGDSSKVKKLSRFIGALVTFLWWMLFHREIKIVHVHASSGASFWRKRLFINIAKLFGKKVIFHLHSGKFPIFYSNHKKTVKRTIEKCDCVIALQNPIWMQLFLLMLSIQFITSIQRSLTTALT